MTIYHDPENKSSEMVSVEEQSVSNTPENNERRKVLKKLALGTAAIAGCSVLPGKWTSPIVEFGALPAHAVTSGTVEAAAAPAPTPAAEPTATSGIDYGRYVGRTNGNRPTWYFPRNMRDYPKQFTLVIDGCATVEVTSNNGHRYVSGSTIIKQSDVPGRGMAVLTSAGCYARTSHVNY